MALNMRLTLKLATNYLLDLLKSGLKEKLNLEEGIAPTVEQLIENSYEEFVTNLQSYKLKYYDVISQASLKPNYEEELRRATFKLNRLLDSGLRENLNLKNNQAPSKQKLREFGHRSFLWDIYKKGLRYNQVVERAGLKPNTVRNKWKNFNLNEAANKLLEIVNSEKLKKINLPNGIAPSIRLLKENGYSDFWWAFKNKNFSYTDAVKNAGLKFQSRDIITEIGNSLHWILENILLNRQNLKRWQENGICIFLLLNNL